VLGTAQSGLSDIRFADFLADTNLLREARTHADGVIATDPRLEGIHAALRAFIDHETLALEHRS
jgi:ATP-dependent DNA helicase RecG